ncbi:MAG: hypothetical protein WD847_15150 [Pirellulales bacterium]
MNSTVQRFRVPALLLGIAAFASSAYSECAAEEAWRFILPDPGQEHEHPPLRAIDLSDNKPDDLREKVVYRGSRQRYAQIRYGSPNSVPVAVVLDQVSPAEADLYVDANRSRSIEAKERVEGQNRIWRLPLAADFVKGDVTTSVPRAAIFRLSASGRTLSYAAAGYLEGVAHLGDRRLPVRRMDGDGNGFFTDSQDRLWVDLDNNGAWNPVSEQFLYSAILTMDGVRYAVKSDELASRLALEKLEGTGTIRLADKRPIAGDRGRIVEVSVTLAGRDGSAVGLRHAEGEATVPIGEYRVCSLMVSCKDPDGGPNWNFVFSDYVGPREQVWYNVGTGETVELEPLSSFDFQLELADAGTPGKSGGNLRVQPRLFSADGLVINTCYRGQYDQGRYDEHGAARILLSTLDGQTLNTTYSGFA